MSVKLDLSHTVPTVNSHPCTEVATKPQDPKINDTIESSASEDASCCLIYVLSYVKEKVVCFFKWLCSCLTASKPSLEEEPLAEEIPAASDSTSEDGAQPLVNLLKTDTGTVDREKELPKELLERCKEPIEDDQQKQKSEDEAQPLVNLLTTDTGTVDREKELRKKLLERYKEPIKDDQQAMLYLSDLVKITNCQLDAVVKGCGIFAEKRILTQQEDALLSEPLEKLLSIPLSGTVSKEEQEEVIEMIKGIGRGSAILNLIIENQDQCKKLLNYINKIRKEEGLSLLTMPSEGTQ